MLDKQHPDYERLQKKALEQLRSGKLLFGRGGAFAPLRKQFIEAYRLIIIAPLTQKSAVSESLSITTAR